jgi:hypothetical protein
VRRRAVAIVRVRNECATITRPDIRTNCANCSANNFSERSTDNVDSDIDSHNRSDGSAYCHTNSSLR